MLSTDHGHFVKTLTEHYQVVTVSL